MGSVVLDGAVVEECSIVGAGALVTEGTRIPPFSLAVGMPAKVKRPLTEQEIAFLSKSAQNYVELSRIYMK
jgi:carbonic anhydrase/acetyltransferase-like protein (isoleucine patch superfamily)